MFFSVMSLSPSGTKSKFFFITSWFSIANYDLGSDQ